jgi:7,8-didemethyl-8-hydroxy-5-deazariboflavin synthase CofG subunit
MASFTCARSSVRAFAAALKKARAGERVQRDEALLLIRAEGDDLWALLEAAAEVRDRGRGRTITFSKKIFLPLTNLCRDYCAYCTFRKDPGDPDARTMTPEEVLAVARAGERLGCKEALFSLGDKPERAFPEMRRTLAALGHGTTIEYLHAMCARLLRETTLLPHVNPGVMSEDEMRALKEVSVSMGLMLENASPRLLRRGGPHFRAPDKHPRLRLRMIADAGRLRIPFTTGLLIGIGETLEERVDSLLELRALHETYGHIQEIIIQNFRAKPDTPMRAHPEPTLEDLARTVAVARLLFGGEMNIQVPPNLILQEPHAISRSHGDLRDAPSTLTASSPRATEALDMMLRAGINDWGGISPLTRDYINPEYPWPHIEWLRDEMRARGFELRERLAVYPEFIRTPGFLAPALLERVRARVTPEGYPV